MAIQISTPQDLDNIRNNLYGDYELVNDIDMSGWGNWTPIENFYGTLNGNGHVIKNLTVNKSGGYAGLFAHLRGGSKVENLGLEGIYVQSTGSFVGGLVGTQDANAIISNCFVVGTIKSTGNRVGGLAGNSSGILENCFTDCNVSGDRYIGGLIGLARQQEKRYCYSSSRVDGTYKPNYVGGFYGELETTSGYVPSFKYCYFDSDMAETTRYTTTGVFARTTTQMMQQATYQDWDFENVWGIDEGESYPYLLVFQEPEPKQESRLVTSYINKIHSNIHININLPPQSVIRDVNSYFSPISGSIQRRVAILKNVEGYLSPIHSNVTTSVKTTHKGLRNVTSYINALNTNVVTQIYRQPLQVTRDVTSYVKPIYAYTDVLTRVKTIPIIAYSSVITNPSSSTFIANPSYSEVVK